MRPLDEALMKEVTSYPHYRDVDHVALAERIGPDLLEKRLRVQMRAYEKARVPAGQPWLKWVCPVYRKCVELGLWGMGQLQKSRQSARDPEWVEREEWFPTLPEAFDGFRVLHLTDFHFDFIPDLPEIIEQKLVGNEFDFCALTGDFRGEVTGPTEHAMRALARTRPFLGEDVAAVLGNHDSVEILSAFPEMNIRGLINEAYELRRGDASILIAGVDDAHMYKTFDFAPLRDRIQEADFTLALSHSPEAYRQAEEAGANGTSLRVF